MIKTFKYMRRQDWLLAFLASLLTILRVYFELKIPEFMKRVTELIMTDGSTLREIWTTGGWMLLSAFGNLAVMIVVAVLSARVGACFATRLRTLQFDRVSSFSMEEINGFSTA
ncbi:MAG: ABC transporter ATP-binding protein, partial [Bacteroidales bacterium]|nr:ABC transporter ATP-binding protein [Bacteroidales bacterium]